tara:strand:- start:1312 stop:1602 length:291 start_codon:yes stop_codon:yes gene_type:complete
MVRKIILQYNDVESRGKLAVESKSNQQEEIMERMPIDLTGKMIVYGPCNRVEPYRKQIPIERRALSMTEDAERVALLYNNAGLNSWNRIPTKSGED